MLINLRTSCTAAALVLSFLWLFGMKIFATIAVWLSLILGLGASMALCVYSWYSYYAEVKNINNPYAVNTGSTDINDAIYNQRTLLAIGKSYIFSALRLILTHKLFRYSDIVHLYWFDDFYCLYASIHPHRYCRLR